MKKFMFVLLAMALVLSLSVSVVATDPFAEIDVPKCTTAPEIDGVISSGEYKYISSYDENDPAWNFNTRGIDEYDVTLDLYATWDDTYFYFALKVKNIEPEYTPGPNGYALEQPNLLTAMVYDDPTLPVFASADGKDWEWTDAQAASFSREWLIATDKDNNDIGTDYFGKVREHEDYKWAISHGEYDIYEQAIPWDAIAKTEGIEVGGKCGFAFSCGVKSVTEDYEGGYICFASGIDFGKNFERYALVNLTENEPFEDSGEESESETSAEESDTGTVPTGDNAAIFMIIAIATIAAATIVVAKVRR